MKAILLASLFSTLIPLMAQAEGGGTGMGPHPTCPGGCIPCTPSTCYRGSDQSNPPGYQTGNPSTPPRAGGSDLHTCTMKD